MNEKSNRIDLMLKELKISCQEFADKMDMSVNAVYNWKKRNLGPSVINKIVKVFPQVNTEWLLTGNGEILKATEAATRPFLPTGNKLHDDIIESVSDLTFKNEGSRPNTSSSELILEIYTRCIHQLEDDRLLLKKVFSEVIDLRKQMEQEIEEVKTVKMMLQDALHGLRTSGHCVTCDDTTKTTSKPVEPKK